MRNIMILLLLAVAGNVHAEWRELASPAAPGSLAPELVALDGDRAILTWLESVDGGHVLKYAVLGDEGFDAPVEIAAGADWFANWADTPRLHVLPDGDWLVHWLRMTGPATYDYDIVMRRSRDAGESWSRPFSPHTDGTQSEHGFVSYFDWDASTAGVVWLDGRETAAEPEQGSMTLRTAALDEAGQPRRETLLDKRVCDCCQTAAGMTDHGPVVVYRDRSPDEIRDISIVRHVDGRWSEPQTVHADGWRIGGCPVNGPALLARGDEVIVAWFTMPGGEARVRLARSVNAGADFELIGEFARGTALGRVDLAAHGDGFMLTWLEQGGDRAGLHVARFDAGGEPAWQRRMQGLSAGRSSGFPRLAVIGERIVLAWAGSGEDGRPRVQVAETAAVAGASD